MKKLLVFALLLSLCVSLCACVSMDKFKDNLGSDYKKEKIDDDDLEDYADLLDIDIDDYDVKSAVQATHKTKGTGVMIIECGSSKKAEKLAKDADEIIDMLEDTYGSSYSFVVKTKGRFVLFGEKKTVNAALDK